MFVPAIAVSFLAFAGVASAVTVDAPATRPASPVAEPATMPASPVADSTSNKEDHHLTATHNNAGIGTRGHHPRHGKVHGHKTLQACMKHCQEHHKEHMDAVHKAAMIKECHDICHDHHTGNAPVNPNGVARSGKSR